MRENVTAGEISFRKGWLQTIADRVDVHDDTIRIIRDKANLKAGIADDAGRRVGVRSSAGEWCASQNKTVNTYFIEIAR